LGNIDAQRDWGHARDYVEGMWMILQQEKPDDYVLATGETHPVREFVEKSFKVIDLNIRWEGHGVDEVGYDQNGVARVRVDAKYFRPTEVDLLLGDPAKAERQLGWVRKVNFDSLVTEMVQADLSNIGKENLKW